MTRVFGAIALVLVTLLGLRFDETHITVQGSDTMVILGQRWAEAYMNAHPDITVQVTGGGSGTGISALINGTTDICNASRPIKDEEKRLLKEKYGTPGVEIKTAIDGLSVYVHPSNPLKELSLAQLKDIYTGKVTNWKDVGGPEGTIVLYGRESNSGTYAYFKEEVLLNQEYAPECRSLAGTASIANAVSKDTFGIGYGGVAYRMGIKELMVKKDAGSKPYPPSVEEIRSGNYPISRYLYIYLQKRPTGEVKNYIDWILSKAGQDIVSDVGYVRIK